MYQKKEVHVRDRSRRRDSTTFTSISPIQCSSIRSIERFRTICILVDVRFSKDGAHCFCCWCQNLKSLLLFSSNLEAHTEWRLWMEAHISIKSTDRKKKKKKKELSPLFSLIRCRNFLLKYSSWNPSFLGMKEDYILIALWQWIDI